MLPHIATENRFPLHAGNGFAHEWIILIGGGNYFEFPIIHDQPRPAAAEPSHSGGFQFLFEHLETAERRFNVIGKFATGGTARFRTDDFPKHRMIGVSAAVIADHTFDV